MRGTLLLLVLAAATTARAEDAGPATATATEGGERGSIRPEVWVDVPEDPKVGDDVEWHVRVDVPAGVRLLAPEGLEIPPDLLLLREGIALRREVLDADRVRYDLTVPLRVAGVGWIRIPPQRLRLELPSGGELGLPVPKVRFYTGTHFPTESDPVPAAPLDPVSLPETNWVLIWALIIVGVAATATVSTLLVIRWRRRHHRPPPSPPVPPHERALARLARLAASDLLEKGSFASFYTELSETLREYLGGRFGFDSMDLTTTELTARLKRVRMEGLLLEEVVVLLGDFDLVKFAKVEPAPSAARAALRQVEALVLRTREEPTTPPRQETP
ncbi:MAG: hypothetical protein FJ098_01520 [Deltaproteobacteria bacterium]|nr:hypothetical protein [Deltaproteobacteria bacterium]